MGKPGKPGEQVRCVVSVQMLTEGWDVNNVTHILGFRAVSSQLLCEQVEGRGLRCMDYTPDPQAGLLTEEFVVSTGFLSPSSRSKGAKPTKRLSKISSKAMYERYQNGVVTKSAFPWSKAMPSPCDATSSRPTSTKWNR